MGWFWASKEENVQKNLQNHIDRLNAEVKTLRALNSKDNSWTATSVNTLEDLNRTNKITLQALKEKQPVKSLLKDKEDHEQFPENVNLLDDPEKRNTQELPAIPAIPVGGTRKRRKNKKHKKKTYRH